MWGRNEDPRAFRPGLSVKHMIGALALGCNKWINQIGRLWLIAGREPWIFRKIMEAGARNEEPRAFRPGQKIKAEDRALAQDCVRYNG